MPTPGCSFFCSIRLTDQAGPDSDAGDHYLQGKDEVYHERGLRLPSVRKGSLCRGVETKEELDIVRQTECDLSRDFYFYKPLEWEEMRQVLESQKKEDILSWK